MVREALHSLFRLIPGTAAFHQQAIRFKLPLLFYLTSLSALLAVGYYGYYSASHAYRQQAMQSLQSNNVQLSLKMEDFLQHAQQDMNFITNYYALLRYAYWTDIGDTAKMEEWRTITADTLLNLAESKAYYYKIRYIDNQGNERIVVRVDPLTGKAIYLQPQQMQHYEKVEYIDHARLLNKGQMHISPINLNMEYGRIEQPYVPVFRISTPLIGNNGVRYGIIVVIVRAEALYHMIRDMEERYQGSLYLVDQSGSFLYHPDASRMFGQQLGHGDDIAQDYPDVMPLLLTKVSNTFQYDDHFISSYQIHPDKRDHEQTWILVGIVPESTVLAQLNNFLLVFFSILLFVLIGIMVSSRYMIQQLMLPLIFVTAQLQRLGRGEAKPETLDYPAHDEIRHMLNSTHRVVSTMQQLAAHADGVAAGNFSNTVTPLSEQDLLSHSINNMTRQLAQNRSDNEQQSWLKDGVAQLALTLTGEHSTRHLADLAISMVGRYLDAGRGVLYVRHSEQLEQFDLLGTYMYTERPHVGAVVKSGEGAVGQVAREHKPIILQLPDHHPLPDAAPVVSGTSELQPRCVYSWPLLHEDDLLGVMELATLSQLSRLQQEYLGLASEAIAASLHGAIQRERIQQLLRVAERSAKEADERSRDLQLANTQMEEQQQQLQQQTQALQKANAMMEEQQQQLQQQTEELQQSNAQMEEQQQQLQQQTEELKQSNAQMEKQQHMLQSANAMMEEQAAELENRNRALEQASRYKSDFLANMSHELRTPLNSIILLSRMFTLNESQHLDEEEMRRATVIHRAGNDLLSLINDILDLSKIEAGHMDVFPQAIEPEALMQSILHQFEDLARDKGVTFRVENSLLQAFVSDHDKLQQILRNLLSNAFKFTKEGSVTLSFEPWDDSHHPVCLAVRDSGIGIPQESLSHIFDAFKQVDGSISRKFGGTGLGLSISLRLARLLGGDLTVESTLNQGSTFRLLLPQELHAADHHEAVAPAAETAPPALERAATPVADDRGFLMPGDSIMLVIDDDAEFCRSIACINRQNGYKTLLTASGEEGLRMAKTYHPDGILLDLGLPDLDGFEVLKRLKADSELSLIPVYVISARDRSPALTQHDIVGYLQKPVDDRQILAAELAILHHSNGNGNGVLLVVESEHLKRQEIETMVANSHITVHAVADCHAAHSFCTEHDCALILLDHHAFARFEDLLLCCRQLHHNLPSVPLLVYSHTAINDEQAAALRAYTANIIIQTEHSGKRLLENIERFVKETRHRDVASDLSKSTSHKRLQGRCMMVVDDDARNLFVVTSALEQQGATVVNALNAN